MSDLNFWVLFLSTAFVLCITPGPTYYLSLVNNFRWKKIGTAASIGMCAGAMFHSIIVAIGISAILVFSATAFTVVKIIGVVYLLYLAYQAFNSADTTFDVDEKRFISDRFNNDIIGC